MNPLIKRIGVAAAILVPLTAYAAGPINRDALALTQQSVSTAGLATGNVITVPLTLSNSRPLAAATIPLRFGLPGDGVQLQEVRFDARTDDFDLRIANIDNNEKTVLIALIPAAFDGAKEDMAPGSAVVADLIFEVTDPGLTSFVIGATTLGRSQHQLMWVYNEEVEGRLEVHWTTPAFDPLTVSVASATQETSVPRDFALDQNYPNPFNPSTAVRFAMPQPGHVSLAVYNILGQKVRTLIDEDRSAGAYTTVWDGRDDGAASMSSGVYLYRLVAEHFVATRKMTLLK